MATQLAGPKALAAGPGRAGLGAVQPADVLATQCGLEAAEGPGERHVAAMVGQNMVRLVVWLLFLIFPLGIIIPID